MELKIDETLKALIELGKRTNYLTWDQVNAQIPPDTIEPERLDQILEILEQNGISIIEEDQAPEQEPDAAAISDEDLMRDADLPLYDDGDGKQIDDPVRMYLTQMGEIPLLSRNQEINLAKKIEVTRRRFRRKVLECDFALRSVVETLKRVHTGELPFDRTVKVSQTENLEKEKILARMPHNLRTLEPLMEQNVEDFNKLIDERTGEEDGKNLRRLIKIRRRKTVTLIEELSIRTQKVQPLMKKLEQISQRMVEIERELEKLKGNAAAKEDRANLKKELRDLMLMTLEEPEFLR